MDLKQGIDFIRSHEKELTLFNLEEPSIADKLRRYFDSQNVRVRTATTANGLPRELAVLSTERTVLTLVDVMDLRELVEVVPAGEVGIADTEYEEILTHLKETTFTSCDKAQLLYASREIEDRARRVGGGTIHAGFQRVSRMGDQQRVYRDLAKRGITVHAYGLADATRPDFGGGQIHLTSSKEIEQTWFVIFDGGGRDDQKTAMLAEQRDDDDWYGAWTYDSAIVDGLCDHLEATYLDLADDRQLFDR